MSRILVTGASGFIGRHLVPALDAAGHEVHPVDSRRGDVAEEATWHAYPDAEVVIHLAGRSFVPDSWTDPAGFARTNVLGTIQALEYARQRNARVVHLSSYLYGTPRRLPISETAPLRAPNPYALSKLLAEEACRFHATTFGLAVTMLRPFNVYGPGQPDDFLIPTIARQIRAGVPIRVKDLAPRRDYVHVRDVVAAIVLAARDGAGLRVFNVGRGRSFSVQEIVDTMQAIAGTALPVESQEIRRRGEIMDTVADVAAAGHALGWRPRIDPTEGLRDLLQDPSQATTP